MRLARETRGIALREISEQTRISMRYLEAIESDDYRRLPGGIFNRSFIRAYAKHIGYDEQEALEEYSTMMHERGGERPAFRRSVRGRARSGKTGQSDFPKRPARMRVRAILFVKGGNPSPFIQADEVYSYKEESEFKSYDH